MILPAALLLIAYLLGSIPSAYLAGKLTRGIDLRQHGSGNLGATNVYRVLGSKIAAIVLIADGLKGALPVLFFPRLLPGGGDWRWALAFGIAAIAGHVKSAWMKWKGGGKGVATAGGVFLALAPIPSVIAIGVWVVVVLVSGYVSLSSLAAAVALPIAIAWWYGARSPYLVVSILVAAFVFWTHRANIGRLSRGEEHRFGRKKPA